MYFVKFLVAFKHFGCVADRCQEKCLVTSLAVSFYELLFGGNCQMVTSLKKLVLLLCLRGERE
uniref:Putative ovule protein n=1 Tax=Solanum chacoense TaxID=4108 RepID=A0A0V0H0M5_SOLCH